MKIMQKVGTGIASLALAIAPMQIQGSTDAVDSSTGEETDNFGLESDNPIDLDTLLCWDLTTLSEDDRAFALVLLFGYAQGLKGDASVSPREVQVAVVNTVHECVDQPNAMALDILKTHLRD